MDGDAILTVGHDESRSLSNRADKGKEIEKSRKGITTMPVKESNSMSTVPERKQNITPPVPSNHQVRSIVCHMLAGQQVSSPS